MDTQSPLMKSSLPLWVESYPKGYINMKNEKISKFKPNILKYKYAMDTTKEILKRGDNSKIKMPHISRKETTLPQTKAISYESFIVTNENIFPEEKFFLPNMASHMQPIWVLIVFLLAIWIIYFVAK